VLARLVVDGVIEVWSGESFLSGPAAADLLLPARSNAGQGRIAEPTAVTSDAASESNCYRDGSPSRGGDPPP
jgi:hypothetical protein